LLLVVFTKLVHNKRDVERARVQVFEKEAKHRNLPTLSSSKASPQAVQKMGHIEVRPDMDELEKR
jgi:hypothetical protein